MLVAIEGGDFSSVQDALDSITDASAATPYLVRVAPGVYPGRVAMKPHVDIRGAGRDATVLTAPGGGEGTSLGPATVQVVGSSTLADLTVSSIGGENALAVSASGSATVERVTALASGASSNEYAVFIADDSSPDVIDVVAVAEGTTSDASVGMFVLPGATPRVRDSELRTQRADGGVSNALLIEDGHPTLTGTRIESTGTGSIAVVSTGPGTDARIHHSFISGEGAAVSASSDTIGITYTEVSGSVSGAVCLGAHRPDLQAPAPC